MNILDTVTQIYGSNNNRPEYTVQNKGSSAVKFTHKANGTFEDDFGILLEPDEGYVFTGHHARQQMYAISATGNSNRVLIMDPGNV